MELEQGRTSHEAFYKVSKVKTKTAHQLIGDMAECWICLRSHVEQGQQGQLIPAQSACGRHAHAVCLQELKAGLHKT